MSDAKLQYRSKKRKINDLIESIKSRLSDYDNEKIDWGHVGTLEHIICQLNDLDNSLSMKDGDRELSINEKSFNAKTRRFDAN